MNTTTIIVAIILTGVIVLFFVSSKARAKSDGKHESGQDSTRRKVHHPEENVYGDLRGMALSNTPEQLGLTIPEKETVVFGVVMDWGIDDAVATTVAYRNGEASLYLSSGGGVIGGGQHEQVNKVAKQFVSLAQKHLKHTKKTNDTPLPKTDEVIFYLLTNNGTYTGKEQMKNFENETSGWTDLFYAGNDILSELRKIDKK